MSGLGPSITPPDLLREQSRRALEEQTVAAVVAREARYRERVDHALDHFGRTADQAAAKGLLFAQALVQEVSEGLGVEGLLDDDKEVHLRVCRELERRGFTCRVEVNPQYVEHTGERFHRVVLYGEWK